MQVITQIPCRVHMMVCGNRRPPGGLPSCGEIGGELFDALKKYTLQNRLARKVWVTQTQCLGFCHANGLTLAIYYNGKSAPDTVFIQSASVSDIDQIIQTHVLPYL